MVGPYLANGQTWDTLIGQGHLEPFVASELASCFLEIQSNFVPKGNNLS